MWCAGIKKRTSAADVAVKVSLFVVHSGDVSRTDEMHRADGASYSLL